MGNAYQHNENGLKFLNEEKFQLALTEFQVSLKLEPLNYHYNHNVGMALIGMKKYQEALGYFQETLRINPKYAKAYNQIGFIHYIQDENLLALEMYDKAIQLDPKDMLFHFNKCNVFGKLGRFEEVMQFCNQLNLALPINKGFIGIKANILINQRKFEEALQILDNAIKQITQIDPSNSDLFYFKAECLRNMKKHKEALRYYDQAIQLNPKNSTYQNNKGISLSYVTNNSGDKKYHDMQYELKAKQLRLNSKYEEAIINYDKALQINPKKIEYHLQQGNCFKMLKNYQEAIKKYNIVIESQESNCQAILSKAQCLICLQNFYESYQLIQRSLEIDPKNVQNFLVLGSWFKEKNQINDALNTYFQGLKINPTDSELLTSVGIILRMIGNIGESLQYFDQAIQNNTRQQVQHVNYYQKSLSLNELEKYDESLKVIDQAVELNPSKLYIQTREQIQQKLKITQIDNNFEYDITPNYAYPSQIENIETDGKQSQNFQEAQNLDYKYPALEHAKMIQ